MFVLDFSRNSIHINAFIEQPLPRSKLYKLPWKQTNATLFSNGTAGDETNIQNWQCFH